MSLDFIVGDTVEVDQGGSTITGTVTAIHNDKDDVETIVEVTRTGCSPNEFARDDEGSFDFMTKVEV